MSTPPRRVEIEAKGLIKGSMTFSMWNPAAEFMSGQDALTVSVDSIGSRVYLHVRDAHAAREYAQALRGAADALVEYAEQQETASNAAANATAARNGWVPIERDTMSHEDPAGAQAAGGAT